MENPDGHTTDCPISPWRLLRSEHIHEHDFQPVIHRPATPPYFEMIVGYKCACGKIKSPWGDIDIWDPLANAAAMARSIWGKTEAGYRYWLSPGYTGPVNPQEETMESTEDEAGRTAVVDPEPPVPAPEGGQWSQPEPTTPPESETSFIFFDGSPPIEVVGSRAVVTMWLNEEGPWVGLESPGGAHISVRPERVVSVRDKLA